jgi:hypothetical protein
VTSSASGQDEHFASGFIHSRLLGFARGWDRGLGQRALLACAPDERHTFVVYVANCDRLEPVVPQLQDLAAKWALAIGGGTTQELAARCGASRLPNDPMTAADHVFV